LFGFGFGAPAAKADVSGRIEENARKRPPALASRSVDTLESKKKGHNNLFGIMSFARNINQKEVLL
jgi:hypothetical protein